MAAVSAYTPQVGDYFTVETRRRSECLFRCRERLGGVIWVDDLCADGAHGNLGKASGFGTGFTFRLVWRP